MPDPAKRETPKGQAKGASAAQQDFLADTRPVDEPALQPQAAQPVTPNVLGEFVEPLDVPEDEIDGRFLVDLEDGQIDLGDVLFGAGQPDQDVRTGLPGFVQRTRVTDTLSRIAMRTGSQDAAHLLNLARNLDL